MVRRWQRETVKQGLIRCDWLCGVRDVFLERPVACCGWVETQFETGVEIQRRGSEIASACATGWPRRQTPPGVSPGLKRDHRRNVGFGRALFQILIKERPQ